MVFRGTQACHGARLGFFSQPLAFEDVKCHFTWQAWDFMALRRDVLAACRVPSVKRRVWRAECVEWRAQSVECGVWSWEWGLWSVECLEPRVWSGVDTFFVAAGCRCRMPDAGAGAGCRCRLPDAGAVAWCRMPMPDAGAGGRCRMPVAGCRCRMPDASGRWPVAGCRMPAACMCQRPDANGRLPDAGCRCRIRVPGAGGRCASVTGAAWPVLVKLPAIE